MVLARHDHAVLTANEDAATVASIREEARELAVASSANASGDARAARVLLAVVHPLLEPRVRVQEGVLHLSNANLSRLVIGRTFYAVPTQIDLIWSP